MFKVWVDTTTGNYGLVKDLRVLDPQWYELLKELFNDVNDDTRIKIAQSLGTMVR